MADLSVEGTSLFHDDLDEEIEDLSSEVTWSTPSLHHSQNGSVRSSLELVQDSQPRGSVKYLSQAPPNNRYSKGNLNSSFSRLHEEESTPTQIHSVKKNSQRRENRSPNSVMTNRISPLFRDSSQKAEKRRVGSTQSHFSSPSHSESILKNNDGQKTVVLSQNNKNKNNNIMKTNNNKMSDDSMKNSSHSPPNLAVVAVSQDFQVRLHSAALTIQRWYRARHKAKEENRRLVRALLSEKRREIQHLRNGANGKKSVTALPLSHSKTPVALPSPLINQQESDIEQQLLSQQQAFVNVQHPPPVDVELNSMASKSPASFRFDEKFNKLKAAATRRANKIRDPVVSADVVFPERFEAFDNSQPSKSNLLSPSNPLGEDLSKVSKNLLKSSSTTDSLPSSEKMSLLDHQLFNPPPSETHYEVLQREAPPVPAVSSDKRTSAAKASSKADKLTAINNFLDELDRGPHVALLPENKISDRLPLAPPSKDYIEQLEKRPLVLVDVKQPFLLSESEKPVLQPRKNSNIQAKFDELLSEDKLQSEIINGLYPSANPADEISQKRVTSKAENIAKTFKQQKQLLEEKSLEIIKLQSLLEEKEKMIHDLEIENEARQSQSLAGQRVEYEATIARHLSFIDKLIQEKKDITRLHEEVVGQLTGIDKRYSLKIKGMEEKFNAELKRQKEAISAGEKQRREKWIDEQSKKIKEMTIKGLEPEIQRILVAHQREVEFLTSKHEKEIRDLGGDSAARYAREAEKMKQEYEVKIEQAVKKEREQGFLKAQGQLEELEKEYQSQRRKYANEIQEERDRMARLLAQDRHQLEQEYKLMREADIKSNNAIREDCERTIQDRTRKMETELRELKEQLAIEKESWEEMFMRKQLVANKQREEKIREEIRRDRDKEIEMVVTRLEEEASKAQKENEKQMAQRIRKAQERFDLLLKETERSEKTLAAKFNETKQQLGETHEEVALLKGTLTQKDMELQDQKLLLNKLTKERDNLSEVIKLEFQAKLAENETTIEGLRKELSDARTKYRMELGDLQQTKDAELDAVHQRVKAAILKKDETIQALRSQLENALTRAAYLEKVLEDQSSEILSSSS